MKPVSSAMGMNCSGGSSPRVGWLQRTRASNPCSCRSERETMGWYWRKSSERPSAQRNPLVISRRSSMRDRMDDSYTSTRFLPFSLASYMAESASLSSCSVDLPGSAKATPTLIERPTC